MATAIELAGTLLGMLKAAGGERTLNSLIGQWRQRVSRTLVELADQVDQLSHPSQTPGTSDYVQVGFITTDTSGPAPSGSGQVGLTDGSDVLFDDAPYGNLGYALGVFTLEANKVYRLSANLILGYSDAGAFANFYWVDADTNLPVRTNVGRAENAPYDRTLYSGDPTGELLLATGATSRQVKLRLLDVTAGTVDVLFGSNALIHEI